MSQKGLAPILIVILIAVLVGGYLLYQNQTKPVTPSQPQNPVITPQTPQATSIPSTILDETANWKAYTSSAGKFSVRYPIEWKVLSGGSISTGTETISFGPDITGVTEDSNIKMWIQMRSTTDPNSPIKNAEDYKNSLMKGYGSNPSSNLSTMAVTIDGVSGFKVNYIDVGVKITNLLIDKNGLIYSLALRQTQPYLDQDQQIFNQILSTFKFLP